MQNRIDPHLPLRLLGPGLTLKPGNLKTLEPSLKTTVPRIPGKINCNLTLVTLALNLPLSSLQAGNELLLKSNYLFAKGDTHTQDI